MADSKFPDMGSGHSPLFNKMDALLAKHRGPAHASTSDIPILTEEAALPHESSATPDEVLSSLGLETLIPPAPKQDELKTEVLPPFSLPVETMPEPDKTVILDLPTFDLDTLEPTEPEAPSPAPAPAPVAAASVPTPLPQARVIPEFELEVDEEPAANSPPEAQHTPHAAPPFWGAASAEKLAEAEVKQPTRKGFPFPAPRKAATPVVPEPQINQVGDDEPDTVVMLSPEHLAIEPDEDLELEFMKATALINGEPDNSGEGVAQEFYLLDLEEDQLETITLTVPEGSDPDTIVSAHSAHQNKAPASATQSAVATPAQVTAHAEVPTPSAITRPAAQPEIKVAEPEATAEISLTLAPESEDLHIINIDADEDIPPAVAPQAGPAIATPPVVVAAAVATPVAPTPVVPAAPPATPSVVATPDPVAIEPVQAAAPDITEIEIVEEKANEPLFDLHVTTPHEDPAAELAATMASLSQATAARAAAQQGTAKPSEYTKERSHGLDAANIDQITARVSMHVTEEISREVAEITQQHLSAAMETLYSQSFMQLTEVISRDLQVHMALRVSQLVREELKRQGLI